MAAQPVVGDHQAQLAALDAERRQLANRLTDLPWSGPARKAMEERLAAIDARKEEVWAAERRRRLRQVVGAPPPADLASARPLVAPRALRLRAPRRDWRTMLASDDA